MKRFRNGLLACLLGTGMLLSGCHGSGKQEAFTVPKDFDTSKNYSITFWAKNDTNKTQTDIYNKAIQDFEAIYPNIDVTIRLYTNYGDIYNDVITNIATDTTPDVCITYPDHIATYMTGSNTVVPLDGLMNDPRYGLGGSEVKFASPAVSEIIPEFLKECEINGTTYAMPYMRSTEAVYINEDFVNKLGYELPDVLTWDFIWEVSEKAAGKNADGTYQLNGQKVMIPFLYKSTDNMMIQMLKQKGAGYSDEFGNILLFNDDTKEILNEVKEHTASGAFSTFKISSYPANFLNAGQCVFAVDSTAGSTWMGSDAPLVDIAEESIAKFHTAVRPVPQYDPEHPQMISQGPSICIFNKKDPGEVMASWLFTQYLLTNDVQESYAETEGYVPVTSKAQNDPAYQDYLSREGEDSNEHYAVKIQATKMLLANTANTFTTPVFNGSASLRDCAGQLIENVAKSTRRKETIDDAYYASLKEKMIGLYHLDSINAMTEGTPDLGPLPPTAKALLAALGITWILILLYLLKDYLHARKEKRAA